MSSHSVYDARNHLSRLVADAESGIEATITRHGRPVARLVPAADTVSGSWDEWFDAGPRVDDDFLVARTQGVGEERTPL